MNLAVRGDILLRCRHKRDGGKRSVPMFRATFHTGYTSDLVLRFSRTQVDGLARPERYPDDFFVELIFSPVDTAGMSCRKQYSTSMLPITDNYFGGFA